MRVFAFKLPDVGEGTAEAEIVAWHAKVGDRVVEDAPLIDVMTDKATVEITSPVTGTVLALNGAPGDQAAIGSVLVEFDVDLESVSEASASTPPTLSVGKDRFSFKLPDVGEGTAEAEIVAWHAKVGDRILEDAPLIDVMTDKATVEITSPVTGVVLALTGAPGDQAAVGSVLVEFEVDLAASAPEAAVRAASASSPAADVPPAAPTPSAIGRTQAAPAVRARAVDLGIDLAAIAGTGPDGRVVHADLDRLRPAGPPRGLSSQALGARREGVTEIRLIGLRRRIAEKMQESKRRIPHFAYVEEVDMTALEELRARLNEVHAARGRLTVLPFVARALCRALPDFPQVNATFDDEAGVVRQHAAVHLGVATQTPAGLMVPVVRHAEARDLWDASREVARVAAAARDGSATREDLSGSTITVTSLGPLGGVVTTPVINHPEVAIIGPNRIVERPVVRQGQVVVRRMMNLSSSFDHRVVDGYDAAAFIQRIKALLEQPAMLWVE